MRDDDLIDAAAHAMTRGEPTAQLRQTVRARIGRRQELWPIWGRGALACVAALLLIVVARTVSVPRGEPDTPRPTPVEQTTDTSPGVPTVEDPNPPPQVAQVSRPRPTGPARALDPIAPLVIEPMTTPLMAVGTSSGVMPIEIDDLRIEPLQIE